MKSKIYRTARDLWHKANAVEVPLQRLLCGGEHGLNGIQLSRHTGDVLRTSTHIDKSPHFLLLRDYDREGETILTLSRLRKTAYFKNAASCIELFGSYFSATSDEDIVVLARNFIARYLGTELAGTKLGETSKFSGKNDLPICFPISFSNCYQLHDGNHRAAIALAQGRHTIKARVVDRAQLTCLQELLLEVGWNANKLDLYQPIVSPELGKDWQLVRRCDDRLEMMKKYLIDAGFPGSSALTYLDVACNYGWFVAEMSKAGYSSHGFELDAAARKIGIHFLGVSPEQIIGGNAVNLLRSIDKPYDIVSCFSLAHHFIIRDQGTTADDLLALLAKSTRRILFFEMGDANEGWFKYSLAGWPTEKIHSWLEGSGHFSAVIDLGRDKDRRKPFDENYQRTLFACIAR